MIKKVKNLKNNTANISQKAALPALISRYNLTMNTLLAGLFSLLLVSFAAGCAEVETISPGADQPDASTINREEDKIMEKKIEETVFTIPPIDQDIPVHLETATLALG